MKKDGFTLVEMMVAIGIFALIAIFLYQSYASFNLSNKQLKSLNTKLSRYEKIKKTLYLDFALALEKKITVLNQERDEDVVLFQTSHSIHRRFNPYVAYLIKQGHLFRLESLRKLSYPFDTTMQSVDIDDFGKANRFRVFLAYTKESNTTKSLYLIDARFSNKKNILYKVIGLNSH